MEAENVIDYVKKQQKLLIEELNSIDDASKICQLDQIYTRVEEMKKNFHQYLPTMVAYNIEICNKLIKELENNIQEKRSKFLPKKSFKFSFTQKNNSNNKSKVIAEEPSSTASKTNIKLIDNCRSYKNLNDQYLMLDSTNFEDFSFISLNHCNIRITGVLCSIRVVDCTDCTIFTGPVSSSAFIENCQNCEFQLIGRQIRIHDSKECKFYLHVTSRTIIENSNNLKFGCYNWFYNEIDSDFVKSGIEKNVNNWNQIDDFNCLNTNSPNWSIIDE